MALTDIQHVDSIPIVFLHFVMACNHTETINAETMATRVSRIKQYSHEALDMPLPLLKTPAPKTRPRSSYRLV